MMMLFQILIYVICEDMFILDINNSTYFFLIFLNIKITFLNVRGRDEVPATAIINKRNHIS